MLMNVFFIQLHHNFCHFPSSFFSVCGFIFVSVGFFIREITNKKNVLSEFSFFVEFESTTVFLSTSSPSQKCVGENIKMCFGLEGEK